MFRSDPLSQYQAITPFTSGQPGWVIAKKFTFEAAHRLPNHDGKCQRLHGHSYRMTVYVGGYGLEDGGSSTGMVLDFGDISRAVKPLLSDYLDHHDLNATTELDNPTAEEIARWVWQRLIGVLPGLVAIHIGETCTSECWYSEAANPLSLLTHPVIHD